jgi:PAS domain S-box-containing protein
VNELLIFESREYVIFDCNFKIERVSSSISKYADTPDAATIEQDIRNSFPELFGLEDTCLAILNREQKNFKIEGIKREQTETAVIYFDLLIQNIEDKLVISIEDVTELMLLRQSLVQKINESEIVLNTLRKFEDCTNKIVSTMADLLFITTIQGKIERVNQAARKIFGYKKSELIGRSIDSIMKCDNFNHQQICNALFKNIETSQKIEITCSTKQQKTIEIEFNCFIVSTEIQNVFNCVYMGRDITARKQAEAEIREALAKEQELRRLKSSFISMASHEFRNPLSSILLCTEVLNTIDELNIKPEYKFYLKLIEQAALNMRSLLEDILIISKTEAGKQIFQPNYCNLEIFCEQIIQEIQLAYEGRIIEFEREADFTNVYIDDKLIWHIINNLLSNAIKYSQQTEIVKLKLSPTKLNDREGIKIAISDRGIGIPEEAIQNLFDSFYRCNNVGDIPGTGLGLSIVKKSVELHGGEILVESQLGKGTTITAIIPVYG